MAGPNVVAATRAGRSPLPRDDVALFDDYAGEWWRPGGAFAMLHWLARARAELVPPAARPGSILVDVGCGAGLLAPRVQARGHLHIGLDLAGSALEQAAAHGVQAIRADVARLPLPDGCADVVCAGQILEHVADLPTVVAELCRVLRPGGRIVLDTLADTLLCRLLAIELAERVPGIPRGIHDHRLLVDPDRLRGLFAGQGIQLRVRGIRPAVLPLARWLVRRHTVVPIVPSFSKAILYQGVGNKP